MEQSLKAKVEIPADFPYKPNENKLYERSLTTCSPVSVYPGRNGELGRSSVTCCFKRFYTAYEPKNPELTNPKNYRLYTSVAIAEVMVPGYDAPPSSMVYPLEDKTADQLPLFISGFPELCKWWEENQGTVVNEQTGQIIATKQVWITIEEQLKRLYPETAKKEAKEKKDDNSNSAGKTNSGGTRAATA